MQVVGPERGAGRAVGLRGASCARPGRRSTSPQLAALRAAGIPVTTATALWLAEHGPQGVLGVSGTKGKSTTAALAAHLAARGGRAGALAGNIGVPALELLDAEPARLTVLELSSYQIADLDTGPEAVLMTNLFKEHTEWHGSEEAYRREKLRLLSLPEVRIAVAERARAAVRGCRHGRRGAPLRGPRRAGTPDPRG